MADLERVTPEELMRACWMRSLPYDDVVAHGAELNVKPMPSRELYERKYRDWQLEMDADFIREEIRTQRTRREISDSFISRHGKSLEEVLKKEE